MLAIDIALIPSQNIFDVAIAYNKKIVTEGGTDLVVLDAKEWIPHISLFLAGIEEQYLLLLIQEIGMIVSQYPPFQFVARSLRAYPVDTDVGYEILVDKTPELLALHAECMQKLVQYCRYDVKVEDFYNAPVVREKSITRVNNFPQNQWVWLYRPHITLWVWAADVFQDEAVNVPFASSTIQLYQLWNYCTCQKLLHSWVLS